MRKGRSVRTSKARPSILGVIPVSGRDPEFRRGLPRLAGRPLLDFTFEAAKQSRLLSRVIVTTDDRRIADAARRAGLEAPFLRPSSDARRALPEVIDGAARYLEQLEPGYSPTWLVRLQVTFPFREPGMINRAIRTVLAQDLDSAFIAFPEYDTYWNLDDAGAPERLTTDTRVPRAKRRPIYRELGGLFSMMRRDVVSRGTMYGNKLGILPLTSVISAIDIHGVHGRDLAVLVARARQSRRS